MCLVVLGASQSSGFRSVVQAFSAANSRPERWQEVRDWYPVLSGLSFSEHSDLALVAACTEKERVVAQQGRTQQKLLPWWGDSNAAHINL